MVTKKREKPKAITVRKSVKTKRLMNLIKPHSSDGIVKEGEKKLLRMFSYRRKEGDSESVSNQDGDSQDESSREGEAEGGNQEDGKENDIEVSSKTMAEKEECRGPQVLRLTTGRKKQKKHSVSVRILELAEPKALPKDTVKDLQYEPFKIPKAALSYKASKRINQLAKPVLRETTMKKDAFIVKRSSLRAICSERIKVLAEARKVEAPRIAGPIPCWSAMFRIHRKVLETEEPRLSRKAPALTSAAHNERELFKRKIDTHVATKHTKDKKKMSTKSVKVSKRIKELSKPRVITQGHKIPS